MSNFNYEFKWAELNNLSKNEIIGKAALVDKTSVCKVYLYTHFHQNKRSIIIKLSSLLKPHKPLPEVIGVNCRNLYQYAGLRGYLFVIEQKFDVHTSISEAFMSEISRKVVLLVEEKDLFNCLQELFDDWKTYFVNITDGLSRQKQLGLYGELLFMRKVLFPEIGIEKSLEAWKGYMGNRHDFEIPGVSFEIKCSETKVPLRITISNEKQLNRGDLVHLYLIVYDIISSEAESGDLPSIINILLQELELFPQLYYEFRKNIMSLGYDFNSESKYNRSYTVVNSGREYFEVKDDFPTIVTEDIHRLKNTTAIMNISYEINMDACDEFRIHKLDFQ